MVVSTIQVPEDGATLRLGTRRPSSRFERNISPGMGHVVMFQYCTRTVVYLKPYCCLPGVVACFFYWLHSVIEFSLVVVIRNRCEEGSIRF